MKNVLVAAFSLLLLSGTLVSQTSSGPIIRLSTNEGDIDVQLLPESAPKTVANFLNYMNRGDYNGSIIHRSVPGFVIQGGGFKVQGQSIVPIPSDPAVRNEFSISNTRGTLAMAKLGTDPNSATNQWFFNLANNSGILDEQNGGFTVFGRITSAAGLAVIDKIAALPIPALFASPLDQLPVIIVNGAATPVVVSSVTQLVTTPAPAISANGIATAAAFGGSPTAAPGSFLEIYGANLGGSVTRAWTAADFVNGNAPTSLEGVSVTVDGKPAYVYFVSPGQINIELPANVATGGMVPVVVTFQGQASAPVAIPVQPIAAGLLAPASYNIGGKQYVVASHSSNGAAVSNGSIAGVPAAPATPGETVVLYGIGFGAVNPAGTAIAGQIAQGSSSLSTPVQFTIGGAPAAAVYAGLAPGLVGLYQFNITIPADAASGDLPVQVSAGGNTLPQTLFIPVQGGPAN